MLPKTLQKPFRNLFKNQLENPTIFSLIFHCFLNDFSLILECVFRSVLAGAKNAATHDPLENVRVDRGSQRSDFFRNASKIQQKNHPKTIASFLAFSIDFSGQKPSQNHPKIVPKSIKKSIKKQMRFLIAFSLILSSKISSFWSQNGHRNVAENSIQKSSIFGAPGDPARPKSACKSLR